MKELLDKIKAKKLDQKTLIIVIVVAVILLYLDFSFILKMQIKSAKDLSTKIAKIKKDIDLLNKDIALMQKEGLKEEQLKEPAFDKKIITEAEVPSLLQEISDAANKNNARIIQIKSAVDTKSKDAVNLANKKIAPVIITLDLMCAYHNLGSFLNQLENSENFISISNLKIAREQSDYLRQRINLELKSYVRQ
jgi:Tfp pilus assembly protein PilO